MSLELCVLASGSSGNCTVVRTPAGVILIDAGLGPRMAARRLNGTGVEVKDILALVLTHLDSDHFSANWIQTLVRHGIAVFCHVDCAALLLNIAQNDRLHPLLRPFDDDLFEILPGFVARPLPLAHDEHGSHGFILEGFGRRLGYATDLGRVTEALIEQFHDLDVLALESNYDPHMQAKSSRPEYLKRRITGGRGHLSNRQAFDGIRRVLDRAEQNGTMLPTHIVLLHRSRQCNCPKIVRELFTADPRISRRLVLAEQFHRTEWLSAPGRTPATGEQLLLAWG